jgi:hypothetical protein
MMILIIFHKNFLIVGHSVIINFDPSPLVVVI